MKTSLVITIALFTFFAISEISCNKICIEVGAHCMDDSDCCSESCYLAGHVNDRYCMEPKNNTFGVKVQNGWCSYNASFHNESSEGSFKLLGLNAAHAVLPVGSEIQITNTDNNKTIDVTINTYLQPNNETLLELSKEAAKELHVEDGGRIPCSIYLYKPEQDFSTLKKIIGFSASFFVVVFVVMSFL